MERHLNLIKNQLGHKEQRVFPRFPFCYLTFKSQGLDSQKVFEVRDISFSGMQLGLRDGQHSFAEGGKIEGVIHWLGESLAMKGLVKWVTKTRLGVVFSLNDKTRASLQNFLSIKNILLGLRPLHNPQLGLELPNHLKYWLRADGPIEIFIWQHNSGEYSRFQIMVFENFVEWENGVGLKSGRIIRQRKIETPLSESDEFTFEMDGACDPEKTRLSFDIVSAIDIELLPKDANQFLSSKLTQS